MKALELIKALFDNIYDLMNTVNVPGFGFTFYQLSGAILIMALLITFLKQVIGVGETKP